MACAENNVKVLCFGRMRRGEKGRKPNGRPEDRER